MHGNVWEWCEDWYHENYNGAPGDGSAWLSGGAQQYRVLRGGAWVVPPIILRSAVRPASVPDGRNNNIGFRVVAVARTTTTPPSSSGTTANQTDDLALEDRVRRSITEDTSLRMVTVRVLQGRVRLEGSVPSQELKRRAERLAREGGARSVENRITVTEGMQPSSNLPPPAPPN